MRIGNCYHPVEFGSSNMIRTLSDIRMIAVRDFQIAVEWGADCYQPIPLTEDILLKCGFQKMIVDSYLKQDDITMFTKGYIELSSDLHLLYYTFDDRHDVWYYEILDRQIKYLHELQNLYFALSGEELQIKL